MLPACLSTLPTLPTCLAYCSGLTPAALAVLACGSGNTHPLIHTPHIHLPTCTNLPTSPPHLLHSAACLLSLLPPHPDLLDKNYYHAVDRQYNTIATNPCRLPPLRLRSPEQISVAPARFLLQLDDTDILPSACQFETTPHCNCPLHALRTRAVGWRRSGIVTRLLACCCCSRAPTDTTR